jgi:hypothetical protein
VTKDLVRSERSVKPRAAAPTFELNGTVVPEVTVDSPTTSLGVLIAVAQPGRRRCDRGSRCGFDGAEPSGDTRV